MISSVLTATTATLRGVALVVGGLAGFAVVIAAALFALAMTLALVTIRPIAAVRGRAQVHPNAEHQLEAASVP